MKASKISLLILSAVACASALSCQWKGTAPFCDVSPRDCVGTYNHYWTWGKCGDGEMCVTGYKVYCCDEPSPYSILYWRGTAPFCNADCNDCYTGDDCTTTVVMGLSAGQEKRFSAAGNLQHPRLSYKSC